MEVLIDPNIENADFNHRRQKRLHKGQPMRLSSGPGLFRLVLVAVADKNDRFCRAVCHSGFLCNSCESVARTRCVKLQAVSLRS